MQNPANQVATLESGYIAVASAESLWLQTKPPAAQVASVEAARQTVYSDIEALVAEVNAGTTVSALDLSAANLALANLQSAATSAGVIKGVK
jgi:hypothetical protein